MRIGLDLPDDTRIVSVTAVGDTDEKVLVDIYAFNVEDGSIYKLSDGMVEEVP